MRLKHVKGAEEKIESSEIIIKNPEQHKGKFLDLFQNKSPIHIELGMGKGQFIIEKAKQCPDINFIGIEKFDSVIVRAIEKSEQLKLPNLRFIRMDGAEIENIFDHEIDLIYLNFSDPWPKKRHENRRLTSPIFLKRYESLFRNDIIIEMKTDNRHLFEYSIISFNEQKYHIEELSLNLHEENTEENIETEYEQKFSSKGFPIYKIRVRKPI